MTAIDLSDLPAPPPLSQAGRIALFLDLDGTLAAIEQRPQDVRPEPWRSGLLSRLRYALDGRLAVVSGRALEDVDRILDGCIIPVAAVHGLVRRRADGTVLSASPHPLLNRARTQATEFVARHPGLELEDKRLGLALHFRGAPDLAGLVASEAARIARACGQTLQMGDMVAEIRTPGFDKGSAVDTFMEEVPFEGAVPIFVGDDLTDEDGFLAAQALGGFGVHVGPVRDTSARFRLPGVDAVLLWLEGAMTQRAAS